MSAILPLPSQEELLRLFDYDSSTGILRWKIRRSSNVHAGSRAGSINRNWCRVRYSGKSYMLHRIIWKMLYDEEPPEIDHIDMNGLNNRKDNLRAANKSTNNMNRKIYQNNQVGVKGVWVTQSGKYIAEIRVNRKGIKLGLFGTKEEAAAAYAEASKKYHGKFGRTSERQNVVIA